MMKFGINWKISVNTFLSLYVNYFVVSFLLISDLTLPRVATLKTVSSRLIYIRQLVLLKKRVDIHLQSSSVRCISSRDVITKGPY